MRRLFFDDFELTQSQLNNDNLLKISFSDKPTWVITAKKNNRYMWHEHVSSTKELDVCIHNAKNAGYAYFVEEQNQ